MRLRLGFRGMSHISKGAPALTACSCMAALAVAAAPASAGTQGPTVSLGKSGGLEYLKAKYEQVVTQAGPHADCTGDDVAAGGGGAVSGRPSSAHLNSTWVTNASGDGWTTEATSHLDGPRTVSSYAICGKDPVFWESNGPSQVPGGTKLGLGADCPNAAQDVTAGGSSAEGGDIELLANLSFGQAFDWDTIHRNDGLTDALVEQWVGCSSDLKTSVEEDAVKVSPGKAGKLKVLCERKRVVTGGGFNFAKQFGFEPDGVHLNASQPIDDKSDKNKVPDDGWLVKAYNGAETKETLRAQAICAKS